MEEAYQSIADDDKEPPMAETLMLFTIFAGAAMAWSVILWRKVDPSRAIWDVALSQTHNAVR